MSQEQDNRGFLNFKDSRGEIVGAQLSASSGTSLNFSGKMPGSLGFGSDRGGGEERNKARLYNRRLSAYSSFLDKISRINAPAESEEKALAPSDAFNRTGAFSPEIIRRTESLSDIVDSATEVFAKETEAAEGGRAQNNDGNFVEFISDFDYRRCDEGIVLVRCRNRQLMRLHIPAGILGTKVCAVEKGAFADCCDLAQVVIENGLQRIGEGAFKNCSRLGSLTLPKSLVSIEAEAFSGCSSLGSLTLPESLVSIGAEAFSGCSSLKRIKLPSSLRELGRGAFEGCTSLKKIVLGDEFISVSKRCFYGCSELSEVSLPFGICSIGEDAFRDCAALTEISMVLLVLLSNPVKSS